MHVDESLPSLSVCIQVTYINPFVRMVQMLGQTKRQAEHGALISISLISRDNEIELWAIFRLPRRRCVQGPSTCSVSSACSSAVTGAPCSSHCHVHTHGHIVRNRAYIAHLLDIARTDVRSGGEREKRSGGDRDKPMCTVFYVYITNVPTSNQTYRNTYVWAPTATLSLPGQHLPLHLYKPLEPSERVSLLPQVHPLASRRVNCSFLFTSTTVSRVTSIRLSSVSKVWPRFVRLPNLARIRSIGMYAFRSTAVEVSFSMV